MHEVAIKILETGKSNPEVISPDTKQSAYSIAIKRNMTDVAELIKKEIIKIYRNRALPKELWFEKVDNCIKEYQDRVVKKIEMKNNYTDVVLSI